MTGPPQFVDFLCAHMHAKLISEMQSVQFRQPFEIHDHNYHKYFWYLQYYVDYIQHIVTILFSVE